MPIHTHKRLSPLVQGLLVFLVVLLPPAPGQAASPYQAVQQGNALVSERQVCRGGGTVQ